MVCIPEDITPPLTNEDVPLFLNLVGQMVEQQGGNADGLRIDPWLTYELLAILTLSSVMEESGEDGDEHLGGVDHGVARSPELASGGGDWAQSQGLHGELQISRRLLKEGAQRETHRLRSASYSASRGGRGLGGGGVK